MSKFINLTKNKTGLIINLKRVKYFECSSTGLVWIYFNKGNNLSIDQNIEEITKLLAEINNLK